MTLRKDMTRVKTKTERVAALSESFRMFFGRRQSCAAGSGNYRGNFCPGRLRSFLIACKSGGSEDKTT